MIGMVMQKLFFDHIICFVLGKRLLKYVPLFLLLAWTIIILTFAKKVRVYIVFVHTHMHTFSHFSFKVMLWGGI